MRHILTPLLLAAAMSVSALVQVPLLDSPSGCKFVDTRVNGIAIRFLFDTGCSDVMLTPQAWSKLKKAGVVSDAMLSKSVNSTIADGRQQPGYSFVISTLQLGSHTFHNVRADVAITATQEADCLLGQSLLSQMNFYFVQGNTLSFEPQQIPLSTVDAPDATPDIIVETLTPYYQADALSLHYLIKYAEALGEMQRYQEQEQCYQRMLDTTKYKEHPEIRKAWLYAQLNVANQMTADDQYDEVIEYCMSRLPNLDRQDQVGQKVYIGMLYNIFIAYIFKHERAKAQYYGTIYLDYKLRQCCNITTSQLANMRITCDDEMVQNVLSNLKATFHNAGDKNREAYYQTLLRNAGF